MTSSPESISDNFLLQRTAEGDQQAFEALYLRHSQVLFRYLNSMLRRNEAVEEILQETFLVVWEQAALFEGRASVKTWLFRIAHYKAVSWLRKNQNALSLEESPELAGDPSGVSVDEADALRQALEKLSPKHREVLELAFGQGMTYEEIALVLNCPLGTVKSRVKYALQQMAQVMRRDGWDG